MAFPRNGNLLSSIVRVFHRYSRFIPFYSPYTSGLISYSSLSISRTYQLPSLATGSRFLSTTPSSSINNSQISSNLPPMTMKEVSSQIYRKFHPIVIENFLKTLHTIFKSSKHYSLIISSIHFRAGNDLRYLLDWLTTMINTGEIAAITIHREEPKRDTLKNKLILAYTNYWKYRNYTPTQKGDPNMSKINEPKLRLIVDELVDYVPLDVTDDLINSLKNITNVPTRGKGKVKIIPPEDIDLFFTRIVQHHASQMPHMHPFLQLLDIPSSINIEVQSILSNLEKEAEKNILALSSLLTR